MGVACFDSCLYIPALLAVNCILSSMFLSEEDKVLQPRASFVCSLNSVSTFIAWF